MMLFKCFKELLEENIGINDIFKDKNEYLAHTHKTKPLETIFEHIAEVLKYFEKIIQLNNLELVVDNLIEKICLQDITIGNYIKKLFVQSIIFHDFGKINPNFQFQRMENKLFSSDDSIKIGHEHSFLSAYIFLNYQFNEIFKSNFSQKDKSIIWSFSFLLSIPIIKHHSGYIEKDYEFNPDKINSIHKLLKQINFEYDINFCSPFFTNEFRLWEYFDEIAKTKHLDYFSLFTLLKLNYSLLTASDYYATSEYMNDVKFCTSEDFGLLTDELKQIIISNFDNNIEKPYNGEIISETQKYLDLDINDFQEPSFYNLNILRKKMAAEVAVNIEKNKHQKKFYIEAPTGGGKTNMSLVAIRKLIEIHPEINKIFYVFPFTTLITQTDKAIKDTFGLTNNEVTQLHSKAGFQTKSTNSNEDAKYGNEFRNQIDNLFVNYPVTLLTHIRFFDILKSNKKDTNYLLHRMANSIVIIDELQSYNPAEWDKIKYYISKYAELFNIRFILMSATLPKLDKITLKDENTEDFIDLIPNAQGRYLTNPNFCQRVTIKTDLLENKIDLQELAEIVLDKSKSYAIKRNDGFNNSVYTIIEFIFKKSASKFYDEINKINDDFFDEIFVLSGTIIEPRRKYIIEYLKDKANRKKKILLITTQVVEAGVDIDMDLGFKNQSLIDSDEQLAGRINRNVNKQNCKLFLFKHDTPKFIYGKDFRYEVTRLFPKELTTEILNNKDFNKLYEKVFEKIDKNNKSIYKQGFNDYKANFSRFDFEKIHKDFRLIDSENISLFIPLDIEISCYENERNFSDTEIQFIEENDCICNEDKNFVLGEKVWGFYINLIKNKNIKFTEKNKNVKILSGIMSKFVISVLTKQAGKFNEFCEYNSDSEDFKFHQYLKLRKENLSEIYNLKSGIIESKFEQSYEFV